jgi:hypothetical protein
VDGALPPGRVTTKGTTMKFKITVVTALAVIAGLLGVGVHNQATKNALDYDNACIVMQYDYVSGSYKRVSFSEMDAVSRARADLYECDIEGR